MRELKFRAYIKPLKRYATGLDIIQFHKCCDVEEAGIWTVVTVNEGIFEVDDIIIEQYTGLKDKNGKEIYDGDIVKGGWLYGKDVHIVKYRDYGFYPFIITDFDGDPMVRNVDIEVVGNIYENFELSEGEEK